MSESIDFLESHRNFNTVLTAGPLNAATLAVLTCQLFATLDSRAEEDVARRALEVCRKSPFRSSSLTGLPKTRSKRAGHTGAFCTRASSQPRLETLYRYFKNSQRRNFMHVTKVRAVLTIVRPSAVGESPGRQAGVCHRHVIGRLATPTKQGESLTAIRSMVCVFSWTLFAQRGFFSSIIILRNSLEKTSSTSFVGSSLGLVPSNLSTLSKTSEWFM